MPYNLNQKFLFVDIGHQRLYCFEAEKVVHQFLISSAKNGVGEKENSGCTPRGWHEIRDIIGLEHSINAVFKARVWSGEIYSKSLALEQPHRDWILTRILRLSGLELGRNLGGEVDTYNRFIYIHGVPDEFEMGIPLSHGCIRMRNVDVIELANWAQLGMKVFIDTNHEFLRRL
jgi:hypothetical protein